MINICKAIKNNIDDILLAIDVFLAKADSKLEKELKESAVVDIDAAVACVNAIEDAYADASEKMRAELKEMFINEIANIPKTKLVNMSMEDIYEEILKKIILNVQQRPLSTEVLENYVNDVNNFMTANAKAYSDALKERIPFENFTGETNQWIEDRAQTLAEWTEKTSVDALREFLKKASDTATSVEELTQYVIDNDIRDATNARRFAVNETLRCNSYAKQDELMQNIEVETKTWHHTGPTNTARPGHLKLDGVTIPKDKPFALVAEKGGVYYCICPHDDSLPIGEVVNCRCKIEAGTTKDVTSFTDSELKELKDRARKKLDSEWEREFNAKQRKAREDAGVLPTVMTPMEFKNSTKKDIVERLGGVRGGGLKRYYLVKSGVIPENEVGNILYSPNGKLNSLNYLESSGILTIDNKSVEHVVKGDFKVPNEHYPNGRLTKGGHSKSSFDECEKMGLGNVVEGEYSNGVKWGSIPTSATKTKRNGGHTWFPDSWDDDKIVTEMYKVKNGKAKFVANKLNDKGKILGGVYNCDGVAIVYRQDMSGESFYPEKDQSRYVEGVE